MDKENWHNLCEAYNGKSTGPLMPAVFVIEPTNICNLNCMMCPNQYYKKQGYMQFSLFKNIIDQISIAAGAIMLYFVGEPFLHKNIIEMVHYCKRKTDARIILSTNATLLNKELSKQIVDSAIDEVILCIDGNSESTYDRIRRGGKFREVESNVIQLLETNKDLHKTRFVVQLIKMKINQTEIESFKKKWSKFNCDILITWLDTWAMQFPDFLNLSDCLCPNKNEQRLPCADLWFKMVINWTGKVVICCHDWSARSILGDATQDSIENIWNGELIRSARWHHLKKRYQNIRICKNCFEWSKIDEEYEFLGGQVAD